MPQAFFDSYGNLVRFPARCSPSCSHFSFFQFHFFFQALPPFSFSFSSLNSVAQVRNLVLGWLEFFRPSWHKIYTKIRSCLQIKLTKKKLWSFFKTILLQNWIHLDSNLGHLMFVKVKNSLSKHCLVPNCISNVCSLVWRVWQILATLLDSNQELSLIIMMVYF